MLLLVISAFIIFYAGIWKRHPKHSIRARQGSARGNARGSATDQAAALLAVGLDADSPVSPVEIYSSNCIAKLPVLVTSHGRCGCFVSVRRFRQVITHRVVAMAHVSRCLWSLSRPLSRVSAPVCSPTQVINNGECDWARRRVSSSADIAESLCALLLARLPPHSSS